MKGEKNHLIQLDFIRITAILLVILQHVLDDIYYGTTFFNTWYKIPVTILFGLCHLGVPLFTILSGYLHLLPQKKISKRSYYQSKLWRIGSVFVLALTFYYVWQHFFVGKTYTATEIFLAIVFANIDFLYYLPVIFGLYLITPLLRKFNEVSNEAQQLAFFTTVCIGTGIARMMYYNSGWFWWLNTLFTMFLLFLCYYYGGYIFRKYQSTIFLTYNLVLLCIGSFVTASLVIVLAEKNPQLFGIFGNYFIDYGAFSVIIPSFFLFIILFCLFSKIKLWERSVDLLAQAVFGVYLTHPFILDIFAKFIPQLHPVFVFTFTVIVSWSLVFVALNTGSWLKTISRR